MSSIRYKLACAHIEDSDQTAHPRSLIRVIDGRSMGSLGSKVSSGGKLTLFRQCGFADCFESRLNAEANLYLIMDTGSTFKVFYWTGIFYFHEEIIALAS